MTKRAIPLFLLICLFLSAFAISCIPLESQTPLEEASPAQGDYQPVESDNQLREEPALPEKQEGEITEPQPTQTQVDFAEEYQSASRRRHLQVKRGVENTANHRPTRGV